MRFLIMHMRSLSLSDGGRLPGESEAVSQFREHGFGDAVVPSPRS